MTFCANCGEEQCGVKCKDNKILCPKCDIECHGEFTGIHELATYVAKITNTDGNSAKTRGKSDSDLVDIKRSLEFLCFSMDQINKRNSKNDLLTLELNKKVNKLSETVVAKDKLIINLEFRVSELEHSAQKNNVLVQGLNLQSYAQVVGEVNASNEETALQEPLVHKFITFAKKDLNVNLGTDDIEAIFPIGINKGDERRRPFLVKFRTLQKKVEFYKAKSNFGF